VDNRHTGENRKQLQTTYPEVYEKAAGNVFTDWQKIRMDKLEAGVKQNRYHRRRMQQKRYHFIAHTILEMNRAMCLEHDRKHPPIVVIGKMSQGLRLTKFLAKHFAVILIDEFYTSQK
jgi:hypothetical protein